MYITEQLQQHFFFFVDQLAKSDTDWNYKWILPLRINTPDLISDGIRCALTPTVRPDHTLIHTSLMYEWGFVPRHSTSGTHTWQRMKTTLIPNELSTESLTAMVLRATWTKSRVRFAITGDWGMGATDQSFRRASVRHSHTPPCPSINVSMCNP